MNDHLTCDVNGCDLPALVRVFPTNGETDHSALRCEDCFVFDHGRDWFDRWAADIEDDQSGGDTA